MVNEQPQRIVITKTKSVGLAVALGFLFGPLGLLYSTVPGAIIMFFVNVVVAFVTLGLGLFLTWPICGLWAYLAAKKYNEQLVAGQRQF
jgi:hypothetical protein